MRAVLPVLGAMMLASHALAVDGTTAVTATRIAGTRMMLQLPGTFREETSPQHLVDDSRQCSLLIQEYRAQAGEGEMPVIELSFDGVRTLGQKDLTLSGHPARIYRFAQPSSRGPEEGYLLVATDGTQELKIVATSWSSPPEENLEYLKDILRTCRWDSTMELDPREGKGFLFQEAPSLPYSHGGPRFACFRQPAAGADSPWKGVALTAFWGQSVEIFERNGVKYTDEHSFSKHLFERLNSIYPPEMRGEVVMHPVEIDGMKGYEVTEISPGDDPTLYFATYLFEGDKVHTLEGNVRGPIRDEYLEAARQIAASVKRAP